MAIRESATFKRIMRFPIRSADVGALLDVFLVCAVSTIIVIRFQLWATNYPQLGGGKLHIAHMLWGGLLMMIAIIMMFSFITQWARRLGAVIGGIGFGFFIDELGKFVTKDNDYFFRPTFALIYIIFIIIYLSTRAIMRDRTFSKTERFANSIEILKKAAVHELDEGDKRRALEFLDEAPQDDPLVGRIRRVFEETSAAPQRTRTKPERIIRSVQAAYFRLLDTKGFNKALSIVFLIVGFLSVLQILELVFKITESLTGGGGKADSFIDFASLGSSAVVSLLIIVGVVRLRHSRIDAYRMFDRALLVNIFLVQLFAFVSGPGAAFVGLVINLLFLVAIRYMMAQEEFSKRIQRSETTGSPNQPVTSSA